MSEILAISKELLGLGSTLAKARQERRVSLADYLTHIADCIAKISQAVSVEGDTSHYEFCEELNAYAFASEDIFHEMLSPEKADELSRKLIQAVMGRRLYVEIANSDKITIMKDFGEPLGTCELLLTFYVLRYQFSRKYRSDSLSESE
jgi:hypothetical protein